MPFMWDYGEHEWMPTKREIEKLLSAAIFKLESAQTVSEVAASLLDDLAAIESHIKNRAGIESGKVEP